MPAYPDRLTIPVPPDVRPRFSLYAESQERKLTEVMRRALILGLTVLEREAASSDPRIAVPQ